MKTIHILMVLVLLMGLLFVDVSTTLAGPPPLPSSFYGTVKSKGANVRVGILVSARINGVQYASNVTSLYEGDTVYTIDVPGDDPGTPGVIEGGVNGDIVDFYIGGTKADQTGTWQGGTFVNLNLTAALPDQLYIFLPLIIH